MHDGTNALWQRRVDSAKAGTQIPHLPHSYLFSMECDLYRRTEPDGVEDGRRIIKGVSEPTGESIAMLVIAQSNQEAWAKTRAQMEAHGYDNFLSRIVSKLLCLG